jgi:hypothetical protein
MRHFTIDDENNITIHDSRKAARDTGAGVFSTEEQFADVIGNDNKRLVEIWNSLPGVKQVAKFTNRKVATERIWKAIEKLGSPKDDQQGAADPVAAGEEFSGLVATEAAEPAAPDATEAAAGAEKSPLQRARRGCPEEEGHHEEGCAQGAENRQESRHEKAGQERSEGHRQEGREADRWTS